MKSAKDYISGLFAGLVIGAVVGMLITQFGSVDYKVNSLAQEGGMTYGVFYETWSRTDLLFSTDDPNFAWTMWWYLKAQSGDFELTDQPEVHDGVYNPDDLANKNGQSNNEKN